ncbi:hypothetical protein KGA66_06085 [Actinocrinis puniceicyclus]|uniref:Uncharacterized protein n=1 Tax=Actinocrinis puniceicyclus TaxID=977794 RepID=A0A8J7WI13_9ACTN|nr:hypothetical protein [Actinocrinis puniceicyclus]MBS2962608.1 hypothetical protein [Actinocrinis puniceicyclus]
METASASVYDELEPPVGTDAIEHWLDLSAGADPIEPHPGVALIKARAQLGRLVKQRDWLSRELAAMREAHQGACDTIAQMHKAAVGEVRGPKLGVVEDVTDLRSRYLDEADRANRLETELTEARAVIQQIGRTGVIAPEAAQPRCTAEVSDHTCTCLAGPQATHQPISAATIRDDAPDETATDVSTETHDG